VPRLAAEPTRQKEGSEELGKGPEDIYGVVSRPGISAPPLANSFVIGTVIINNNTMRVKLVLTSAEMMTKSGGNKAFWSAA
jgi:hypothetical protein